MCPGFASRPGLAASQQALKRLLHNWSEAGDGTGETIRIDVYRVSGSRGSEVLHPRRKFGRQQLVVEQESSPVRGFEGIVVVWLPQRSQAQSDGHLRRNCNPPSAVEDLVFRDGKRHGLIGLESEKMVMKSRSVKVMSRSFGLFPYRVFSTLSSSPIRLL